MRILIDLYNAQPWDQVFATIERLGIKFSHTKVSTITDTVLLVGVDPVTVPSPLPAYMRVVSQTRAEEIADWNERVERKKQNRDKPKI